MADNEPTSSAINLGRGAQISKLEIHGNVAGRDVVLKGIEEDAAAARDRQQVLDVLERIEQQVAALEAAPPGWRGDAEDELRKAKEAAAKGDKSRLSEKLESAHGILVKIGNALPDALALAAAVAKIAVKVAAL